VLLTRAVSGDETLIYATVRDVTERKRAEELITRMARYDILTGLSNRGFFVDALEQAIARARRSAKSFAVLYLDLDHFKDVNDTLGHPVGDLLLRAAAERLRTSVRKVDTVARFGGDEFAVILTDIEDLADAALVSDRILDTIGQPIFLHESVAAKAEGRGAYCFFTAAMDTEVRARVSMSAELREAIASDQLFLMYQPQVEIDFEAGTFHMGSESPAAFPADGEGPVRRVTLGAFYIAKYAVTNWQFGEFVRKAGYRTEAERFGWSFVFRNHVPEPRRGPMPPPGRRCPGRRG